MKKYLAGFLVGCILTFSFGAYAASPIRLVVNNKLVTSDVPPQMINGRVMVPARALSEALGAEVEWIPASNMVSVTTQYNSETYLMDLLLQRRLITDPPPINTYDYIAIAGTEEFRSEVNKALEILKKTSPKYYTFVHNFTTNIVEENDPSKADDHMGYVQQKGMTYINYLSTKISLPKYTQETIVQQKLLAGILVHEAHHSYMIAKGISPGGISDLESEILAFAAQRAALKDMCVSDSIINCFANINSASDTNFYGRVDQDGKYIDN